MNDKNKIDLSIEMYEDLKETLVKAIKNAKAGSVGTMGLEPRNARKGRSHSSSNNCNGIRPCPEQKPSRCRNLPTDTTRCWRS